VHGPPSSARDPEVETSDHELGRLLEEAIGRLSKGLRAVFVLRVIEELSVHETAACLEIPEDTVKSRLHRARAAPQKDLLVSATRARARSASRP
jgi:RNA polymerase sigma-70 factor (ECF subfamily)